MAKRLTELYPPGTAVAITFGEEIWHEGVVARHEPPGIWVATANGRLWFVTNGRSIRLREEVNGR